MIIPSQGFRHAATLLLTNALRGLPHDGSPVLVAEVVTQLARDLVALADDMRAPRDADRWLIEEYAHTLDRAAQTFAHRADGDFSHVFETAKTRGAEILATIGRHRSHDTGPRDLFLMYVPEDRLPIAAPLAIELIKRRFTVAFSDFEIATHEELTAGLERGLARHRAGALLVTQAFSRRQWPVPGGTTRFCVLQNFNPVPAAADLAVWLRELKIVQTPDSLPPKNP